MTKRGLDGTAIEAGRRCTGTAPRRRSGQSRRRRARSILLVLLAAFIIGLSAAPRIVSYSMSEPSYETMVVRPGDTLWSIARRIQPGMDPRKTVYEIKKLNELQSVNLRPGQTLMIPSQAVCSR